MVLAMSVVLVLVVMLVVGGGHCGMVVLDHHY